MSPSNKENVRKRINRRTGQPLRSLLPAPAFTERSSTTEASTSGIAKSDKSYNTRAACTSCRKHKCKCDGIRPSCARCTKRSEICLYERGLSETSLQALRRRIEQLENHKTVYEDLYEILQKLPEESAYKVLQTIRKGGDADKILRFVQDGDLLLQITLKPQSTLVYEFPYRPEMPGWLLSDTENRYLHSMLYQTVRPRNVQSQRSQPQIQQAQDGITALQNVYSQPYHVARLVEERLDASVPSLWTAVSCNDKTMRRIFKAYFRDVAHLYMFFQADYFLDDLVEGRRRYCSSLLVNAVLALGSVYDAEITNKSEYWNPSTLLYQFMAEAKRLWDLECARTSASWENILTTIQGGLILNHVYSFCGIDRLGVKYLKQSIQFATSIGIFDDLSSVPAINGLRDVMSYTAWATFCRQSFVAFIYGSRPLLSHQPKFALPNPHFNTSWYGELFVNYHPSQRPIPLNNALFHCTSAKLWIIVNDIAIKFNVEEHTSETVSSTETQRLYERLLDWFGNLPPPLSPEKIALPAQISIHMFYYYLVIFLFGPRSTKAFQQSNAEDQSSHSPALIHARRMLETLIRLFYLRHGSEAGATLVVSSLLTICCSTQDTMKKPQSFESLQSLRSTLILCLKFLYNQGAIFHVVRLFFALVRDNLDEETRPLVPYAAANQQLDPVNELQDILQQSPIVSDIPLRLISLEEKPENGRLTELLEEYDLLTVRKHDDISCT